MTKNDPSAPANVLRFDAQLLDSPTGLYDLRARTYDAALGRFLQIDPVPADSSQPDVFKKAWWYAQQYGGNASDYAKLVSQELYTIKGVDYALGAKHGNGGDIRVKASSEVQMKPELERAIRLAIDVSSSIVDGSIPPYEGARKIWWDVWTLCRYEPEGGELAPFIGYATEWEENPEARGEIEERIRRRARSIIETWKDKLSSLN